MPDLSGLLSRLIRHDVEFVIVGGFAAVAHGSPLMTMDMDICCDMSPANIRRLHAAVGDLHPVHRMTPARVAFTSDAWEGARLRNLYLDTDWGQLDCLGEVTGVGDFAAVSARSDVVVVGSGRCRLLSLEALIDAKRAMGRDRDMETIKYLKAIREQRPGATDERG